VRADSGFFSEELLEFLEERNLTYIVVARLTRNIIRKAAALRQWVQIDENYAVSEFETQLFGWNKPRRFVVVRELVRDTKQALGRKLLDVPGYTFRILATNRSEDAQVLWRDYNQRATIEQRIEELKAELNADGFFMKQFFCDRSGVSVGAVCLQPSKPLPKSAESSFALPATGNAPKCSVSWRRRSGAGRTQGSAAHFIGLGRF
jgi:hypothetical protein